MSLCYVYDAQAHTLTLKRGTPVKKLSVAVKGAKSAMLVERT